MKEFKDYTIADFTERVKMSETNLVGKRVVVTYKRDLDFTKE